MSAANVGNNCVGFLLDMVFNACPVTSQVCTSEDRCFCYRGFAGDNCGKRVTTPPPTQDGVRTSTPPPLLLVETNISLPPGVLLFDVDHDRVVTTLAVEAVRSGTA